MNFRTFVSLAVVLLLVINATLLVLCGAALSQNVSQWEIHRPHVEIGPSSEETMQAMQQLLDDVRREGQSPYYSDEQLQMIQELLERYRGTWRSAHKDTQEYLIDLLRKGLAHREQINSGEMVITRYMRSGHRNGYWDGSTVREITIAFDEDRRRVERSNSYSNRTPINDVGCIGCYRKDNRLLLQYQHDDQLQRRIYIFDVEQLENRRVNSWERDYGFVVQYLASFPGDRFPAEDNLESARDSLFETALSMLDLGQTEVTITEEDHKGTMCKKITIDTRLSSFSTSIILMIAPEQGYALRKYSIQQKNSDGSNFDALLEVDVALDEKSGIWFPSAWRYEGDRNGRLFRENVTIKDVVLNQPLPEKLFDMRNIEIIPAGARAIWRAELVPPPHDVPLGQLLWDGNDFVTQGMFTEGLIEQMEKPHNRE